MFSRNYKYSSKSGPDYCLNLDLGCNSLFLGDHASHSFGDRSVVWTPLYPSIFQRLPASFMGLDKVIFCDKTLASSVF